MDKAARDEGASKRTDMFSILRLNASQGRFCYFAYGSNIHVSQMAQRCPHSLFVGTASLSGFRWQINERGVANIVRSPNDCVKGLVYLVDAEDERRLDRSEGVSSKCYQKRLAKIDLVPHRSLQMLKTSHVSAELELQRRRGQQQQIAASPRGQSASLSSSDAVKEQTARHTIRRSSPHGSLVNPPSSSRQFTREKRYLAHTHHRLIVPMPVALLERAMGFVSWSWRRNKTLTCPPFCSSNVPNHTVQVPPRSGFSAGRQILERSRPIQQIQSPLRVKALIYISEQHASDGVIREEYIHRMQKAMSDGLMLGISAPYVERCIDPLVNHKRT